MTWADGLGEWEDGYNSGALRKAVDAGLVDMNELVQVWKSKPIPEGPVVLRKALPEDTKIKMTGLMASLKSMDADCAYNVFAGEKLGLMPITMMHICPSLARDKQKQTNSKMSSGPNMRSALFKRFRNVENT